MTDAELDQLRNDGALLRAVISQSVKLQRSGSRWRGLCPFHAEDTPSFTVFDDGHFHCFGCDAHGSVIDYVMQSEGIDFREACDRLAAELGGAPRPKPNGKVRGEDWHPVLPVQVMRRSRPKGSSNATYCTSTATPTTACCST